MKTNQSHYFRIAMLSIASAILLLFIPGTSGAQTRWSLALRSAANFPVEKLGNTNLKTGLGFEGTVGFRFLPYTSAIAGWSWNHFSSDQSFAGANMDFEETGYELGVQFNHPIAQSRFCYLLAAGAIYNHIEVENSDGDIIANSGHGFGWQAEAGLPVKFGKYFSLVPGARYRCLSRDIKIEGVTTHTDLRYISAALTFNWNF